MSDTTTQPDSAWGLELASNVIRLAHVHKAGQDTGLSVSLGQDLVLPDGLQVTHRFSISTDRQQLRVVTTVASSASRTPFTLQRFYYRFEKPSSGLNCIETLSMKRVCSTTDIVP